MSNPLPAPLAAETERDMLRERLAITEPDMAEMHVHYCAAEARALAAETERDALRAERDETIRERDRAYVGTGECCDGYEGQIAVLQQVVKDTAAERDALRVRAERAEKALTAIANRTEGMRQGFSEPPIFEGFANLCRVIRNEARAALAQPDPAEETKL